MGPRNIARTARELGIGEVRCYPELDRMTRTHEHDVIPPAPRVPSIVIDDARDTGEAVEAKQQGAPPPKKRSELAAAGALFVLLLGAISLVCGAVTLVMF
jgi:hypothetical protein